MVGRDSSAPSSPASLCPSPTACPATIHATQCPSPPSRVSVPGLIYKYSSLSQNHSTFINLSWLPLFPIFLITYFAVSLFEFSLLFPTVSLLGPAKSLFSQASVPVHNPALSNGNYSNPCFTQPEDASEKQCPVPALVPVVAAPAAQEPACCWAPQREHPRAPDQTAAGGPASGGLFPAFIWEGLTPIFKKHKGRSSNPCATVLRCTKFSDKSCPKLIS